MDRRSGGWINAFEDAVQASRAFFGLNAPKAITQSIGARRTGEETEQQRAQVEAGAAGDDGQMAPAGDVRDGNAGVSAIVAGRVAVVWRGDIDEVMRDLAALFERWLGRADLEIAIDGDGVAADHFSLEELREAEGQRGFATSRGAEQDDQERVLLSGLISEVAGPLSLRYATDERFLSLHRFRMMRCQER